MATCTNVDVDVNGNTCALLAWRTRAAADPHVQAAAADVDSSCDRALAQQLMRMRIVAPSGESTTMGSRTSEQRWRSLICCAGVSNETIFSQHKFKPTTGPKAVCVRGRYRGRRSHPSQARAAALSHRGIVLRQRAGQPASHRRQHPPLASEPCHGAMLSQGTVRRDRLRARPEGPKRE
jgi:hypothetical protein